MKPTENKLQQIFPNAQLGRDYFAALNAFLVETHGFTPENTRFAEGGCCDEINEPELLYLEEFWGERFKFGGLAGYCHAGKTGLNAVSHHVPNELGQGNLLLVAGPHIGYHDGQWGEVPRRGQNEITVSCGSLAGALSAGRDGLTGKPTDPLDLQQAKIESILLDYFESIDKDTGEIVAATQFVNQRIDRDLLSIVRELKASFPGKIAVVTGVMINTAEGNFFAESEKVVL